jgi:hypothetical protein
LLDLMIELTGVELTGFELIGLGLTGARCMPAFPPGCQGSLARAV